MMAPKVEIMATSFNDFKSISRPTRNRRKATPIKDMESIIVLSVMRCRIGPMSMPTKTYENIIGCLKKCKTRAVAAARMIIIPN